MYLCGCFYLQYTQSFSLWLHITADFLSNYSIMKKVSLFLVWVFCACVGLHAASYGILINGSTYYEGTLNSNAQNSDFTEYMALGIPVSDGDQLQLYDKENATGWVVALDAYSTSSITLSGEHYVCSATG